MMMTMIKPFVLLTLIAISCFSLVVPVKCATTTTTTPEATAAVSAAAAAATASEGGKQKEMMDKEENRKLNFKDILVAGYAVEGDEGHEEQGVGLREGRPHSSSETATAIGGTIFTSTTTSANTATTSAACENVFFEYMTHIPEPNMTIQLVKWNQARVSNNDIKIFGTSPDITTTESEVEVIFETKAPEMDKEYKEIKCLDLANTCYIFFFHNDHENNSLKGFENGYVQIMKDDMNLFQMVDSKIGCYVGVMCGNKGDDVVEANVKQIGIVNTEMLYVAFGAHCQN